MGSIGVEEPVSSELVLVDERLARRARAALPDPPWLVPALVELRDRPPAEPAAPPVRRRRPRIGSVLVVLVALATLGLAAAAFVPLSPAPSFVATPVEQAAPAAPEPPPAVTPLKPTTKPKPPQPPAAVKPRKTPLRERTAPTTSKRPAAKTRTTRRASKAAPAPEPLALTRSDRAVAWRRYPAAVYYLVYLRRGAKTLFETKTLLPPVVIPRRLRLRPGTYRIVVRPAIPSDAGIILGSAIFQKTVRL